MHLLKVLFYYRLNTNACITEPFDVEDKPTTRKVTGAEPSTGNIERLCMYFDTFFYGLYCPANLFSVPKIYDETSVVLKMYGYSAVHGFIPK